jgi:hypothetical protein
MIDLTIPGQMTEGELRGVEHLAQKVPAKGVIVEVGSLFGLSSYTWSTSSHPSVSVYCIDPWTREPWVVDLVEKKIPDCPEFSIDAFKHFTRDAKSIIPIQGRSPDDVRDWDRPVDLFFDDAMHTNPTFRKNLKFWLPKMRPGGIMCGHDYCDEWPDVRAEVDRLAEELGVAVHTRQWLWWIVLPERLPRRTWAWLPFR